MRTLLLSASLFLLACNTTPPCERANDGLRTCGLEDDEDDIVCDGDYTPGEQCVIDAFDTVDGFLECPAGIIRLSSCTVDLVNDGQ